MDIYEYSEKFVNMTVQATKPVESYNVLASSLALAITIIMGLVIIFPHNSNMPGSARGVEVELKPSPRTTAESENGASAINEVQSVKWTGEMRNAEKRPYLVYQNFMFIALGLLTAYLILKHMRCERQRNAVIAYASRFSLALAMRDQHGKTIKDIQSIIAIEFKLSHTPASIKRLALEGHGDLITESLAVLVKQYSLNQDPKTPQENNI